MLVLPEIQIQLVLMQGFAAIGSDIALLDDIFANYPDDMLAEVKTYLADNTVEVVRNWPEADATRPLVAVVNAGDSAAPDRDALGDFFEELEIGAGELNATEYRGIARNGSYRILVLTSDPQASIYLSYLVTTMLVLNAQAFQAAGMHNVLISEADLRFEAPVFPDQNSFRMVTLSCLHYHAVPVTERLLTALSVSVTVEG